MKSNSMKSNSMKMPECAVCKAAGKTEKEYTSHYVRDKPGPDGKTVCPLLLSQNCRRCGKKGHTFKYCKVNLEKQYTPIVQVEKPLITPKNVFALLGDSSDDEEGEIKIKQPKPAPVVSTKEPAPVVSTKQPVIRNQPTYADKLKNNTVLRAPLAPTLQDEDVMKLHKDLLVLRQAPLLPETVLKQAPLLPETVALPRAPALALSEMDKKKYQDLKEGCRKIMTQKCNWADEESSDEEDD